MKRRPIFPITVQAQFEIPKVILKFPSNYREWYFIDLAIDECPACRNYHSIHIDIPQKDFEFPLMGAYACLGKVIVLQFELSDGYWDIYREIEMKFCKHCGEKVEQLATPTTWQSRWRCTKCEYRYEQTQGDALGGSSDIFTESKKPFDNEEPRKWTDW